MLFPTLNSINISDGVYEHPIDGLDIDYINEFEWLEHHHLGEILPNNISSLENNEIVMGLTNKQIQDICYYLKITRNAQSLSEYILNNEVYLDVMVENSDWNYSNDISLSLKGFSLTKEPIIYHSNHLWNKYIFEEMFSLPVKHIETFNLYPYELFKIPYLYCNKNKEEFLCSTSTLEEFKDFVFEIMDEKYHHYLCRNKDIKDINRVAIFEFENSQLTNYFVNYFKEVSPRLNKPIICSQGGYSIYPSSYLSGFSKLNLFSNSVIKLDDVIDQISHISVEDNELTVLPKKVVSGCYYKKKNNNVRFAPIKDKLLFGYPPNTLDEIAISSSLAKVIFGEVNVVGKTLETAFCKREIIDHKGFINRTYNYIKLSISGVVDSHQLFLYHEPYWTTSFFQYRLGTSFKEMQPYLISFSSKDKRLIDQDVKILKKAFPQFDIVNPFSQVEISVNEVCRTLEIIILSLSLISLLISILLLYSCNSLHTFESRKEIGLIRCLGVNKSESKKMIYAHNILLCMKTFIFSTIELLTLSILMSYIISKNLCSGFVVTQNILSYLMMFIFATIISFLTSFSIANKYSKLAILDNLKS